MTALSALLLFGVAGCGGPAKKIILDTPSTSSAGSSATPSLLPAVYDPKPVNVLTGKASYYYGRWIGRKTANGEIYRASDITAAHKTLPFNTMVRVTNLNNGKSVIVRINNRGPYVKGRILDLSLEAAKKIEMTKAGVIPIRAEVLRKIPVVEKPNLKTKRPFPTPTPTPAPTPKQKSNRSTSTAAVSSAPEPSPTPAGRDSLRQRRR